MVMLLDSATGMSLSARRRWAALAVLMIPVLLVSIDNTALSFAVPSLSRDLAPTGNELLWIIDIYPLVLAALLVTMGALGDRIGRRRILLIGGTGFAVVSAAAAFAPTAGALIGARALLGFFGAMLMPATLSLIRNIFTDGTERRMAIAIWAAGFSGGAALGPLVGGWLLEHYWWGSVFLIAVPVLIPLLVLGPALLPESRDPDPGPIDLRGIGLATAALGFLVYAVKAAPEHGSVALLAAVIGGAALVGFVRRMLASSHPMLDVRLFRNPVFSGALLVNLVSVVAIVGFIFFATQHLQLVAGLSPLTAAWLLVPGLVLTVVGGLGAVRAARLLGSRRVVIIGLSFNALGFAVMTLFGHTGSLAVVLIAFGAISIGVGLSETISNDLALSAVPHHKAGSAAAASETAYEIGAVLGTAVLGTLLNLAYRNGLQLPAGLSDEAAAQARSTLGGAFEVAEGLPSGAGQALLDSAVASFDAGVTWTAGIGCLLSVGAVLVARRALRTAA